MTSRPKIICESKKNHAYVDYASLSQIAASFFIQFQAALVALLPAVSYGSSLGYANVAYPIWTSREIFDDGTIDTGLDQVLTVDQMTWFSKRFITFVPLYMQDLQR